MSRVRAHDARPGRVTSEATLNANICKACGASNPTQFAEDPPTECFICGTRFERIELGKKAFMAKQTKLDAEGCTTWRRVDNAAKSVKRFKLLSSNGLEVLRRVTRPSRPLRESVAPGAASPGRKRRPGRYAKGGCRRGVRSR